MQTLGLAGAGQARERRTDPIWGCCASWTPLCRGGAGRRCLPVGRSEGVGQRGQVGGSEAPGLLAPRSEQPGHSCSPPSGGLPNRSRLTSPRAPRSLGPSRGSAKPKKETRVQEFMPQSLRLLGPMSSLTRREGAEGISQASLGAPWANFPPSLDVRVCGRLEKRFPHPPPQSQAPSQKVGIRGAQGSGYHLP